MMTQEQCYTKAEECHTKRLRWSAIFAGALVAVGLGFLFNLFNLGLGFAAYNMDQGVTTIAVSGLIWLIICGIITMFIAGMTAGCLAAYHCHSCCKGMLYGFLTWCLALIFMVLLGRHIHHLIAHGLNFLNSGNTTVIVAAPADTSRTIAADVLAKNLSRVAFGTFLIFVFGAVASMIGACMGIRCRKNNCHTKPNASHVSNI